MYACFKEVAEARVVFSCQMAYDLSFIFIVVVINMSILLHNLSDCLENKKVIWKTKRKRKKKDTVIGVSLIWQVYDIIIT